MSDKSKSENRNTNSYKRKVIKITLSVLLVAILGVGAFTLNTPKTLGQTNEAKIRNSIQRVESAPLSGIAYDKEYTYDQGNLDPDEGYELVGSSKVLSMFYNKEDHLLYIIDKRNGFRWGTPTDLDLDKDFSGNAYARLLSNTIFQYEYLYAFSRNPMGEINLSSLIEEGFVSVEFEEIEKGIRVIYDLVDKYIKVPIEFTLKEDEFKVSISAEKIEEYGDFRLINLTLLPFFGAGSDRANGYVFYPDGSGAITYFKESHPRYYDYFQGYVYGKDFGSESPSIPQLLFDGERPVMMPVFGVKHDDNAFLAIVDEGEYDCVIEFRPSGMTINVNRVYSRHTYRRSYQAHLDNGAPIRRMEESITNKDRTVIYKFLVDEHANYSGMANVYRDYLIEKHDIKKSVIANQKIPMVLEVLGGIEEYRIINNKFISMTSFSDVENAIERLKDEGVDSLVVNLFGWNREGHLNYPSKYRPSFRLGGSNGLSSLIENARENDVDLLLQANLTDVINQSGGFSRNDLAFQGNRILPVSDLFESKSLFSPSFAYNTLNNNLLNRLDGLKASGVTYEKLGQFVYRDFGRRYGNIDRQETAEYFKKILDSATGKMDMVTARGGNSYLLGSVDMLFEIPQSDSGYFFSDRAIPFYQMVINGILPYTGTPVNVFYDYEMQMLQMIEFGSVPSFVLTEKSAQELIYTGYNVLYSSEFDQHLENAINVYNEINNNFGDIYQSYMLSHEIIADDVIKVKYANGKEILINYRQTEFVYYDNTIDAMSYLISEGE